MEDPKNTKDDKKEKVSLEFKEGLTEDELKGVDGAGCGCEDVPVLKKELTKEELESVSAGVRRSRTYSATED